MVTVGGAGRGGAVVEARRGGDGDDDTVDDDVEIRGLEPGEKRGPHVRG